jgi:hypothetical protein
MDWLISNRTLLVVLGVLIGLALNYIKKFTSLPSDEQLNKVKEWLLWAVIYTERELGQGTGVAKLRFCYDMFVQRFPSLVTIISFELFSQYVDEALEKMRHLLETNLDIKSYIENNDN